MVNWINIFLLQGAFAFKRRHVKRRTPPKRFFNNEIKRNTCLLSPLLGSHIKIPTVESEASLQWVGKYNLNTNFPFGPFKYLVVKPLDPKTERLWALRFLWLLFRICMSSEGTGMGVPFLSQGFSSPLSYISFLHLESALAGRLTSDCVRKFGRWLLERRRYRHFYQQIILNLSHQCLILGALFPVAHAKPFGPAPDTFIMNHRLLFNMC